MACMISLSHICCEFPFYIPCIILYACMKFFKILCYEGIKADIAISLKFVLFHCKEPPYLICKEPI